MKVFYDHWLTRVSLQKLVGHCPPKLSYFWSCSLWALLRPTFHDPGFWWMGTESHHKVRGTWEVIQLQSGGSYVHTDRAGDVSENSCPDMDSSQPVVPSGLTGSDKDGSQVRFLEWRVETESPSDLTVKQKLIKTRSFQAKRMPGLKMDLKRYIKVRKLVWPKRPLVSRDWGQVYWKQHFLNR